MTRAQPVVLVVEDHAPTLRMVQAVLEAEGIAVQAAPDAQAALASAAAAPPDVVLQDLQLPDLDGLELARRLRAALRDPPVPILAVSGFLGRVNEALDGDAFAACLLKPVEPDVLVATVRRYLGGAAPVGGGRRVLVVDDEAVSRKLMEVELGHAGFAVTGAADAEAALAQARAAPPDVVVSDVLMPGVDGFRLCAALRRDPALRRVPVVLVSSHYTAGEDEDLARRLGASALVVRGDACALLAAVEAALGAGPPAVAGATVEGRPCDAAGPASPEAQCRDHADRVAAQLERQARRADAAERRLALQEAQLALLADLCGGAAGGASEAALLSDALARTLDACGVPSGAVFTAGSGGRSLALAAQRGPLGDALRRLDLAADGLVRAALEGTAPRLVPSGHEASPEEAALLARAGAGALALVPLTAAGEALGLLVLACNGVGLPTGGLSFLRVVGTEIGGALALARAVRSLAESEQRFRQIAENVRDVFWMTDVGTTRILYVSPAYAEVWGRPAADLVANPYGWLDAVHPEDRPRVRAQVEAQATTHGFGPLEYRIVRPDGAVRWVRDRGFPVRDERGQVYRIAGVAEDVTALHEAEAALRQSEAQLRHAQKMEAVGRLAGGIAHDFNNVLSVVLGHAELAATHLPPDHPAHRSVERIAQAGQRAAALTRQLLLMSRRQTSAPQALDPNKVVAGLHAMFGRTLGEDVELRLALGQGVGKVLIDPSHLEQVLLNLVVNARDAMSGGGTLTLETADVEFAPGSTSVRGMYRPGPYVMLAVTDTGCGMSPDVLAHAFEPFFTTKAEGQGTGIGLSTVHGIVDAAGGCVAVYSEVGHGSCFKVYLPRLAAGVEDTRSLLAVGEPPRGRETVLLVEDDAFARELSEGALATLGYRVRAACDGEAALERVRAEALTVDLLVTDVVMPRLGGRELAARLRALQPDVRVLYCSGYTQGALEGLDGTCCAFLEKPFTPSALARRVRELLDAAAPAGPPAS